MFVTTLFQIQCSECGDGTVTAIRKTAPRRFVERDQNYPSLVAQGSAACPACDRTGTVRIVKQD